MVTFIPEPIGNYTGYQGTPKVPGVNGYVPQISMPPTGPRPREPTVGFSFGNLSGPNSIFYNDPNNRSVAFQMLKDYLNRGGNTRYNSFLDSLAGQDYNRFLSANAQSNGKLLYTDWLERQQNYFPQQWATLPGVARGANPGLYGNSQVYLG
jgi:hypothetical protein